MIRNDSPHEKCFLKVVMHYIAYEMYCTVSAHVWQNIQKWIYVCVGWSLLFWCSSDTYFVFRVPWFGCGVLSAMPPAMTDQLDVWADPVLDGNSQVAVDFLLPTGIYIQMDVPRESTIQQIKQVSSILNDFLTWVTMQNYFMSLPIQLFYRRTVSSMPV